MKSNFISPLNIWLSELNCIVVSSLLQIENLHLPPEIFFEFPSLTITLTEEAKPMYPPPKEEFVINNVFTPTPDTFAEFVALSVLISVAFRNVPSGQFDGIV